MSAIDSHGTFASALRPTEDQLPLPFAPQDLNVADTEVRPMAAMIGLRGTLNQAYNTPVAIGTLSELWLKEKHRFWQMLLRLMCFGV